MMTTRNFMLGMALAIVATASKAGIPTVETLKCPVDGKDFKITGTGSCSTFGGSQDFFLKMQTSCDFATRLPQCPENGLPMYKDFSKDEVALLKDYVASEEFRALAGRSRFSIAKKVDDFLVGKGSESAFGFWYLLAGLQYDRAATMGDPDYMTWLKEKGAVEISKADDVNGAIVRLVLAYADYLAGDFDAANAGMAKVRSDDKVRDHWLVSAYLNRLGACVEARDAKLCPPETRVKTDAK